MKTRTIVIVALVVALTIGLSFTVAYAMMGSLSSYSRAYAPEAYRGYGGMREGRLVGIITSTDVMRNAGLSLMIGEAKSRV